MNEPSDTAAISQEQMTPAPEQQQTVQDFTIPDAYKEKGWASKIKNTDDLWKTLDNSQTLIGKKSVVLDFEKATPNEIEDYLKQSRPQDKSAYKFDEGVDENVQSVFADMLHEAGINAYQGNKLIEAYRTMEKAKHEELYSADGFTQEMEKSFGKNNKEIIGGVENFLKSNLNQDDKKLMDNLPNPALAAIYRLVNNIQKQYGAKEGGQGANQSSANVADNKAQAAQVYNELIALSKRPHTQEEKSNLLKKYTELLGAK